MKSYEIVQSPDPALGEGAGKGWNISVAPVAGSIDPDAGVDIWADAGKGIQVFLRVTIEGPEGLSAYY